MSYAATIMRILSEFRMTVLLNTNNGMSSNEFENMKRFFLFFGSHN